MATVGETEVLVRSSTRSLNREAIARERDGRFPLSKMLGYYPRDTNNVLATLKATVLLVDCSLGLLGVSVVQRTLGRALPTGMVEALRVLRVDLKSARVCLTPLVRFALAVRVFQSECLPHAGFTDDPALQLEAAGRRRRGGVTLALEMLNPSLAAFFAITAALSHLAMRVGLGTTRVWSGLARFNKIGGGMVAKGLASWGAYRLYQYNSELAKRLAGVPGSGRDRIHAQEAGNDQFLDSSKYGLEWLAAVILLSPIRDWRLAAVSGMGLKLSASAIALHQSWERTKHAVRERVRDRNPVAGSVGRRRSNSCSSVLRRSPRVGPSGRSND